MANKTIYLDYAAATPVDTAVLNAMLPYFTNEFYNPSALYVGARQVKSALEQARQSVARSIGARPSEVVFTAGGTESSNLAVHGVMTNHPGRKMMISAIEHDAVSRPSADYICDTIPVDSKGVVDIAWLKVGITDDHVLLSVMYANNEIGTVQPIKEIADIVASIRKDRQKRGIKTPLYLHTDACQAPNYLDIHTARLNIDLMTLNGGKIYGPKQSGVLYVRAGTLVAPLISGGGQEFGVRSGTENIAFAVGFARSLEKAVAKRSNEVKKVQLLSAKLQTELENQYGAVVNGHKKLRLPNNVHVTFPDADNERVLFALDEMGICAAAGSACSASKEEVSSVLKAIGLSDKNAQSSIRFSLGKHTTAEEIDAVVLAMQEAIIA